MKIATNNPCKKGKEHSFSIMTDSIKKAEIRSKYVKSKGNPIWQCSNCEGIVFSM